MIFRSQDRECRPNLKTVGSAVATEPENRNTNNHKNDEKNVSRWGHHLVDGGLPCLCRGDREVQDVLRPFLMLRSISRINLTNLLHVLITPKIKPFVFSGGKVASGANLDLRADTPKPGRLNRNMLK
jgi:hypothetical protein